MDFSRLAFEIQWEQCFSLLDQWKTSMFDQITEIHEEKTSLIEKLKEQAEKRSLRNENPLILNLHEYFQHPSILSKEINSFKKRLNELKQDIIHRPSPLQIDFLLDSLENSIRIRPSLEYQLLNHSQRIVQYSIDQQSPIRFIASSNNQIILVNHQSIIYLYDKFIGFIDQIDLFQWTNEHLQDLSWCNVYKNFLFLTDYSLWSLHNVTLKRLARIGRRKHCLNYLTSSENYLFLVYDQGQFIDRWFIQPDWKLDKRWCRSKNDHQLVFSIHSNEVDLLIYTNLCIQICSLDLIIRYHIDLSTQSHVYSHFTYLSSYQLWIFLNEQTHQLHYFHHQQCKFHSIDRFPLVAFSSMGQDFALITDDDQSHLQIISI